MTAPKTDFPANEAQCRAMMNIFNDKHRHNVKKFIINGKTFVRYQLDIGGNRYRSSTFSLDEFAQIAACSTRTALRWLDADALPPWLPVLIGLLSGHLMPFSGFSGFTLSDDGITTPAGQTLSPGALETLAWRNQENRALWRRIAAQDDQAKKLKTGLDYWRARSGAPIAANEEDY